MSSASASGSVQWPSITPEFVYVVKLGDFQHVLRCADQKSSDHLGRAQMAVSDIDTARTLLTERGPFLLAEKQQKMDDLICDTEEAINRVIKLLTPARVEQISDDSIRINTKNAWALNADEPKSAATFSRLKGTHDKLKTVVHDLTNIKATAQLDNCEVRVRATVKPKDPGQSKEGDAVPSTPSDDANMNWKQLRQLSKRTNTTDASSVSRFSITDGTSDVRSPVSNESTIQDFLSLAKAGSSNGKAVIPLLTEPERGDTAKDKLPIIHELESTSARSEAARSVQDAASPIAETEVDASPEMQKRTMGSFASYRRKNRDSYHEPQTPLLQTAKEVVFQKPGKPLSPTKEPEEDVGINDATNHETIAVERKMDAPARGTSSSPGQNISILSPVHTQLSPQSISPIPPVKRPEAVLPRRLSSATKNVEVFTIDHKLTRLPSLLRAGPKRPPAVEPPYPVSDASDAEAEEEVPKPDQSKQLDDNNPSRTPMSPAAQPALPVRSNTDVVGHPHVSAAEQQLHHRSYSDTAVPQIMVRAPTVPRKPLPYRAISAQSRDQIRLQTSVEEAEPRSRPVSDVPQPISQAGTSGPPSPLDSIHSRALELQRSDVSIHSLAVQGPSSITSSRRTSVSEVAANQPVEFQNVPNELATADNRTESRTPEQIAESASTIRKTSIPVDTITISVRGPATHPNPLSMHPVKVEDISGTNKVEEVPINANEDPGRDETLTVHERRTSIAPSTSSTTRTEQSAYQAQSAAIKHGTAASPNRPQSGSQDHKDEAGPRQNGAEHVEPQFSTVSQQQTSYSRFRDDDLRRPAPARSVSDTVASIGSAFLPQDSANPATIPRSRASMPYHAHNQAAQMQQQVASIQVPLSNAHQTANVPRTYASMSYIPPTLISQQTLHTQPQPGVPRDVTRSAPPANLANDGRRMSVPVMPPAATAVMQNGAGPRQEAKALFGTHVWSPISVNGLNRQYATQQPQFPGPTQMPWSQQKWRPASAQPAASHAGQLGVQQYAFPTGPNGYRQPRSQPMPVVHEGWQKQQIHQQTLSQVKPNQPGQPSTRPVEPHRQHSCHCEDAHMSGAVQQDNNPQAPPGQRLPQHHTPAQPTLHGRTASAYQLTQQQPQQPPHQPHRGQTYPLPQSQPQSRSQTSQSAYHVPQQPRQVRLDPVLEGRVQQPQKFSSTYKSIDISMGQDSAPVEKQIQKQNSDVVESKPKTKKRASWLSHQAKKIGL